MKDIDLGKDYVLPSPGYRGVARRNTQELRETKYLPSKAQNRAVCQDALETAARAEGLPLEQLKILDEENPKSKYHQSINLLKPFRTTSKHKHPVDNAGLFSLMTFNWLTPVAAQAHKKGELILEDIWGLSKLESSEHNSRRLARLWQSELRDCGEEDASLRRVVWKFCRTRILISIVSLMITQLAGFTGPVSREVFLQVSGLTHQEELLSLFHSRNSQDTRIPLRE